MSAYRYVDYFKEKVSEYKDCIVNAALIDDMDAVSMILMRLVQDVNRDTRHKAADLVAKLNNDVINLDMDELR